MNSSQIIEECLLLDLEAKGKRVYEIGAVFRKKKFLRQGRFDQKSAIKKLDDFAKGARLILGHNVKDHDLKILRDVAPQIKLLKKPIIDTLFLSPLAFPEKPYHRLRKDYKLVKDAINDPIADAKLAASLFEEQMGRFAAIAPGGNQDILLFYRFCFENSHPPDAPLYRGMVYIFNALSAHSINKAHARGLLEAKILGQVCRSALAQCITSHLASPKDRPLLPYVLSWLSVAGSNSVLAPWVRHKFPDIVPLLKSLRDTPCDDSKCDYCKNNHDPVEQLKRYFNYPQFREWPQADDGSSLQEKLVRLSLDDKPFLAVLPTGSGKSVCFQLPALVRYSRRGLLTIVISPLQALMKDQVENLNERTDKPYAAALYGLLTPPERGEVLERIRLGEVAILYVAPEQLRNRSFQDAIDQREVGAWIFDEAHCLSKWGHDFRPDYLYALRFILEFSQKQKVSIPPVFCFTATARTGVKSEIFGFFKEKLKQNLEVFDGGIDRGNLKFQVEAMPKFKKRETVDAILKRYLPKNSGGSALVYTATRQGAEDMADYLKMRGWAADTFHAGLNVTTKREVQDQFLKGDIQVVAATNAFGMGIDKDDIRLVVHADIPGSLENYIQEVGRGGRDFRQDAHCILLYNEEDVETQFKLLAWSRLTRQDIATILRGLRRRRARRNGFEKIIITTGELLRDEEVTTSFELEDRLADTKVKIAVSWLERCRFLRRDENHTLIFQGKPLVNNMSEARAKIDALDLYPIAQKRWLAVLTTLMNADVDEEISADKLAELAVFQEIKQESQTDSAKMQTPTQLVFRTLQGMVNAGLIEKCFMLTALVRHKVEKTSEEILHGVCALEKKMLKILQEEAPDAVNGRWIEISLRTINQRLRNLGYDCNPMILRDLLKSLSLDPKGSTGVRNAFQYSYVYRHCYRVSLLQDWDALFDAAQERWNLAQVVLKTILSQILPEAPASDRLLVQFSSEDLHDALRKNHYQSTPDQLEALDRALMYLHEQKVIVLQQGLSILRQAMTILFPDDSREGDYTETDYKTLAKYYSERISQVHIMDEYARLGMQKMSKASGLVKDYFALDKVAFSNRFFAEREHMLERPTSAKSYHDIVEDLDDLEQKVIVAAPEDRNILILAGPGTGKSRMVAHRCAYLLRVRRVPPQSIQVLCFNYYAAVCLRQRLRKLIGGDAKRVSVQTYHGLAMRLMGVSFAELMERGRSENDRFDNLIRDATILLAEKTGLLGLEPEGFRDQLLADVRHILVDEYQDINEDQYAFISALAGRTHKDPERKLNIFAVGDDDQNIFTFRRTNRRTSFQFIRKFKEDYSTKRPHYLVNNYRSTAHIIKAANMFIKRNQNRMKKQHPIRINQERDRDLPGGVWQELDPLTRGRVQVLEVKDEIEQAAAMIAEWRRIKELDPNLQWSDLAVLARTWETLSPIRALCDHYDIPVTLVLDRDQAPPLHRIREIALFLKKLKDQRREVKRASDLEKLRRSLASGSAKGKKENPWWLLLQDILAAWKEETDNDELPVSIARENFYDTLMEMRREKRIGQGVILSTVHKAKGMEFPHVFIPDDEWEFEGNQVFGSDDDWGFEENQFFGSDDDWGFDENQGGVEAERRIFYVAMTRAKKSLTLLARNDKSNPHVHLLKGDSIFRRKITHTEEIPEEICQLRYNMLGIRDLYLSFAGLFPEGDNIHKHLKMLQPKMRLAANKKRNKNGEEVVELLDSEGHRVARLSKKASKEWLHCLSSIKYVRVVGIFWQRKNDNSQQYRNRCRCERWEVPWVEVVSLPIQNDLESDSLEERYMDLPL